MHVACYSSCCAALIDKSLFITKVASLSQLFSFSGDVLPVSTSRRQSGDSLENGKENKTDAAAVARKPQRWRAAAAFKERGKLFTPRKAAFSKLPYLRDSSHPGSKISIDPDNQPPKVESAAQDRSLPFSEQEHSSKGTSSKEGTCKPETDEAEVDSMMTPAKQQGSSHSQRALAAKAFSRRSLQPSNTGASSPAIAAAPSTVSKLWSILKSGAKKGLIPRTADASSSPGITDVSC